MSFSVWLAFAAGSFVMGVIPGPGVTAIVGYALGSGRRTALASVAGIALGNAIAMTLSLMGAGALLAASALAFGALKVGGALYLIGLGLFTLFKAQRDGLSAARADAVSPRAAFFGNFGVGVLHPKTIIFYVAFVPQFIDPHGDYAAQATLLTATFCGIVAASDTAWALVASSARAWLSRPRAALWSKRASGATLIAAGVATAAARR
jgi:threonine/homoserine/homoserine lactone efflux protein